MHDESAAKLEVMETALKRGEDRGAGWEAVKGGPGPGQVMCHEHGVNMVWPGSRVCAACVTTGKITRDQAEGRVVPGDPGALERELQEWFEREGAWERAIDAYAPTTFGEDGKPDPEEAKRYADAKRCWSDEQAKVRRIRSAADALAAAGRIAEARDLRGTFLPRDMSDPVAILAAAIGSPGIAGSKASPGPAATTHP